MMKFNDMKKRQYKQPAIILLDEIIDKKLMSSCFVQHESFPVKPAVFLLFQQQLITVYVTVKITEIKGILST
jgi:hypothetical protein